MRTFRTLATVAILAATLCFASIGPASADPPRSPTAGVGGVLLAPFWFACWALTGTGSDNPSPQCDAIFVPILKQLQSTGS